MGGGALGPDWHSQVATRGFKSADKKVQVEYGAEVKSLGGEVDKTRFRREDFPDITLYEDDEASWNVHVELTNGKVIGCDFVVSATGVVPNGDTITLVPSSAGVAGDDLQLRLSQEGRNKKPFSFMLIANQKQSTFCSDVVGRDSSQ